MYFKNITLVNAGPIENINYAFSFNNDGNPKPLILVGTNGSGKSIFLSHLLNPLMAAQQVAFDNAEVKEGKVYKLRSQQYIRNGATFSYAKVDFASTFSCYEWQLALPREDYIRQFDKPQIDDSFVNIPLHEASLFNVNFLNNPVEISNQFKNNCVLYFPANRFEQPAWLNEHNLNAKAEFIEEQRIDRLSNRRITQQSPLITSKNWLLDIVFDRANYDLKFLPINYPIRPFNFSFNNEAIQQKFEIPLQIFQGYEGDSAKIWNAITQILKLIFRSDENFRFGIGNRKNRVISVVRNEGEFIRNIFQLSTGQTSLLNIVLSILRDFDMSGAAFEKLEDVKGVVIIDEVDAHLHVDLQCNLLPAVISMFPKIQFILTTHSPLFLLGMKAKFGDVGFDIISLPTGEKLDVEEFEEFKSAFDFYLNSNTFRYKIEFEVNKTQKTIIFVEGDYDIKYLKRAALFLKKETILEQVNLCDGGGFGNLDNLWTSLFKHKLAIGITKPIGLIYDCDTHKKNEDKHNDYYVAKKRIIPAIPDSPISKGIENLIPTHRIEELRVSHPQFFDVTPQISKIVRGTTQIQPEICEINKSEKGNLCDWLCANGTAEDFAQFESVFGLIEEIIRCESSQI